MLGCKFLTGYSKKLYQVDDSRTLELQKEVMLSAGRAIRELSIHPIVKPILADKSILQLTTDLGTELFNYAYNEKEDWLAKSAINKGLLLGCRRLWRMLQCFIEVEPNAEIVTRKNIKNKLSWIDHHLNTTIEALVQKSKDANADQEIFDAPTLDHSVVPDTRQANATIMRHTMSQGYGEPPVYGQPNGGQQCGFGGQPGLFSGAIINNVNICGDVGGPPGFGVQQGFFSGAIINYVDIGGSFAASGLGAPFGSAPSLGFGPHPTIPSSHHPSHERAAPIRAQREPMSSVNRGRGDRGKGSSRRQKKEQTRKERR